QQESEADHIGIFLMTFAGYDPDQAVVFWQRMETAARGPQPSSRVPARVRPRADPAADPSIDSVGWHARHKKSETRNPKQIRNTKSKIRNRNCSVSCFEFRILDLFRISDFVFRI